MNLDRTLNLVIPVERSDGTIVHVHATPVSREVFDRFFLVIAKTFSAMYAEGLGIVAGPRVAAKLLKKIALDLGESDAVANGLIAEMIRLSNVIAPTDTGWAPIPLHEAVSRDVIDADDQDEVENALAFFMLASVMHKKKDARMILPEAAKLWSAQITSSSCTAFIASLSTSTPTVTTGEKAEPSRIPS